MVLGMLMVVSVAGLYCSGGLGIFVVGCSVSAGRLVLLAYCNNLAFSFWFGVGYPQFCHYF